MSVINRGEYDVLETDTHGLHRHLLSEMSISSDVKVDNMFLFNHKVKPSLAITNQHSSGRCWLFAGLNMMRHTFIKENNLSPSFEFSQNYLFFWDKFERVNYFISLYQNLSDRTELDSRLSQFLLKEPLGDGGQWQMFVNLVEKYGLVPKSVYPDTAHSKNSRGLNMVLTKKLREYCRDIRENEDFDVKRALRETYTILVKFLGKPPLLFDWEYSDKDGKYKLVEETNAIDFYRNIVRVPLNDYVSITNDPRNEYNKNYGVEYLGNILEGKEVKYMNIEMDRIKELTMASIRNNEPVWFGSDVGQFLHSKSSIMDRRVFDIEEYLGVKFGLNKRERIDYGESLMTHAMVITGFNERGGIVSRWDIENSWGSKGLNKGYYTMTDDWMSDFVYQVVIHKRYLSSEELELWEQPIVKRFPPWDPMGALA